MTYRLLHFLFMEKVLQALAHTPWYVYGIFLYVLYTGIRSFRPRVVKLWVILILPALLMLWSVSIIYSIWNGDLWDLLGWALSILLGSFVGWEIVFFYKYRIDSSNKTIHLPPNRWMIVLLLGLFAFRYFFSYSYATMDTIPPHFVLIDFGISGFLIGIFIGRALHYWRIYTERSG